MKSKITYHEQTDMENTLKLREVLKTLPSFTSEIFPRHQHNDIDQHTNQICI